MMKTNKPAKYLVVEVPAPLYAVVDQNARSGFGGIIFDSGINPVCLLERVLVVDAANQIEEIGGIAVRKELPTIKLHEIIAATGELNRRYVHSDLIEMMVRNGVVRIGAKPTGPGGIWTPGGTG